MDLAASLIDGVPTPDWLVWRLRGASGWYFAADGVPPFSREAGLLEASLSLMRRLAEG